MNLKKFRTNLGVSQTNFTEILKNNGFKCNQQFFSSIENGKAKPPYEMMVAFKNAFPNTLVDDIFF